MSSVATTVPVQHRAGSTLKFTRAYSCYAPPAWTLSFALRGPTAINFSATQSGSLFLVEVAASTTANWQEGTYAWQAVVVKAGETYTVEEGTITILPNLSAVTAPHESRSQNKIMLDLIRSAIQGRIPDDMNAYTIAGRSVNLIPIKELVELESIYSVRVAQEERANAGKGAFRNIVLSFPRP